MFCLQCFSLKIMFRSYEPNSQQSFFVVYNMKTTNVLAVYENTSEKLLDIFENFCDYFRLSCGTGSSYTSSPSNNVYANLTQQRFKQTIISAKVFILNFDLKLKPYISKVLDYLTSILKKGDLLTNIIKLSV